MKRLSDYKGDEAIELWADLLEPITAIFSDKKIAAVLQSTQPLTIKAKEALRTHQKDVSKILLRIDDTPLDGLNIILRLIALLQDFQNSGSTSSFFESAEQEKTDGVSFGSATENTEADEK